MARWFLRTPLSLFLQLSPSRDLPAAPYGFTGVGAASLWGQMWHRGDRLDVGGQGVQVASLQGTHPLLGRAGCVLGWQIFPKELSGAGRGAQALPQAAGTRVCVWCVCGLCALSPGQVQILPLAAGMFGVDFPGDARGRQPSSFPTDGFQGLPFPAETGQLGPLVLGVPAPAGLGSPLHFPRWKQEALAPGKLFKAELQTIKTYH